jgi:FkbM family methyltransferase
MRSARSFGLKGLDFVLARHIALECGFFVEAGANDGIKESNTLLLERECGWTGLLVEPIPQLADRCRTNRPRALVEQVALVAFDYPRSTIGMHYSDLMSVVDGARGSAREDAEWAELGFHAPDNHPDHSVLRTLDVPARPLSAVLDQHRITHVDLLSLDVEGYEPNVLRGLDFNRHRPTYIVVEAWAPSEVDALLLAHYERVGALCSHEFKGRVWQDVLYRESTTMGRDSIPRVV